MTRVTLVAPVAPFRGGIARHSQAVAEAMLRAGVELQVESFARQFPKLLYPGASDRAPAGAPPANLAVRYDLDSLDPLSWSAAIRRIAAEKPDLVVLPVWTFFLAPMLGTIARRLRARGIKVAMIVHNVADHEGARWKAVLTRWQLDQSDAYLTHGEALAAALRPIAGERPVAVRAHPAYSDYPPATGALPREHALELLCFGLVRPYKGVDIAIEALGHLKDRDIRLTVAGEAWSDAGDLQRLARERGVADRVEFVARFVSDQEAAELFARADAVLAPYRSVTGSGVVALARHYRRAPVASDLPGFAEVIRPGKDGWLVPAGDAAALASTIEHEVTRESARAAGQAHRVADDEWAGYAAALLALANR